MNIWRNLVGRKKRVQDLIFNNKKIFRRTATICRSFVVCNDFVTRNMINMMYYNLECVVRAIERAYAKETYGIYIDDGKFDQSLW